VFSGNRCHWPRRAGPFSPGELVVWGPGGVINGSGDVPRWIEGGGSFSLTPRSLGHSLGRASARAQNRARALAAPETLRQARALENRVRELLRSMALLRRLLGRLPRFPARRLARAAAWARAEALGPRQPGLSPEAPGEIFWQWANDEAPSGEGSGRRSTVHYYSSADEAPAESSDGGVFDEDFPGEAFDAALAGKHPRSPFAGSYPHKSSAPGAGYPSEDSSPEETSAEEGEVRTLVIGAEAFAAADTGDTFDAAGDTPGEDDFGGGDDDPLVERLILRARNPLGRTLP
jgi:hypothetical protein